MDTDLIRLFAKFIARVCGLGAEFARDLLREAARRDGKTGG